MVLVHTCGLQPRLRTKKSQRTRAILGTIPCCRQQTWRRRSTTKSRWDRCVSHLWVLLGQKQHSEMVQSSVQKNRDSDWTQCVVWPPDEQKRQSRNSQHAAQIRWESTKRQTTIKPDNQEQHRKAKTNQWVRRQMNTATTKTELKVQMLRLWQKLTRNPRDHIIQITAAFWATAQNRTRR